MNVFLFCRTVGRIFCFLYARDTYINHVIYICLKNRVYMFFGPTCPTFLRKAVLALINRYISVGQYSFCRT